MDDLRTFIAIELSDEIRHQLQVILHELRKSIPAGVRWVSPENIHLTLKFLGATHRNLITGIKDALAAACTMTPSFQFEVKGFGAFPNCSRPRTLWTGVLAGEELQTLAVTCEKIAHTFDIPKENRPFSPHLTLGRVSSSASPLEILHISKMLSEIKIGLLGVQFVDHLTLFKSDLTSSGPIYSRLAFIPLKKL